MIAKYRWAANKKQVAKDFVRAAKEINLDLYYRCNKELHRVEFQFWAGPYELQQLSSIMAAYKRAREEEAEYRLEVANHIYGF